MPRMEYEPAPLSTSLTQAKCIHRIPGLWLHVRSKSSTRATRSETAQWPCLGLWVWQVKGNLSRRLGLPLQEFTHSDIKIWSCSLLHLGEVRKLSMSSAEIKTIHQEGRGAFSGFSGFMMIDTWWCFGQMGYVFTLRVCCERSTTLSVVHIAIMEKLAISGLWLG